MRYIWVMLDNFSSCMVAVPLTDKTVHETTAVGSRKVLGEVKAEFSDPQIPAFSLIVEVSVRDMQLRCSRQRVLGRLERPVVIRSRTGWWSGLKTR